MKTEYEKVLLPKSVQQELEKLRTQAIADAAEIARLQSGFDELKQWAEETISIDSTDSFDMGMDVVCNSLIRIINRITGVEK